MKPCIIFEGGRWTVREVRVFWVFGDHEYWRLARLAVEWCWNRNNSNFLDKHNAT